MFHSTHDTPAHLGPFNLAIQFLIQQPTDGNVLPPNQVQAMTDLGAGFGVILRADDALDGLAEHEVGELIAGKENAG